MKVVFIPASQEVINEYNNMRSMMGFKERVTGQHSDIRHLDQIQTENTE